LSPSPRREGSRPNVHDSTGLNLLLAKLANARTQGRRLLLVRPRGAADRIFRLTLLEDRFEFVEAPAAEG